MKTIFAKPLSKEAFEPFGTYSDFFEPSGSGLGDFYPDRLQISVARGVPFGFSPLVVRKPEKYLVDTAEYHNFSGEILVPIDGDILARRPARLGPRHPQPHDIRRIWPWPMVWAWASASPSP